MRQLLHHLSRRGRCEARLTSSKRGVRSPFQTENNQTMREHTPLRGSMLFPECKKSGGAGGTASCRGYRGRAPNPCAAALSPQTSVALFAGNGGQLEVFRQTESIQPPLREYALSYMDHFPATRRLCQSGCNIRLLPRLCYKIRPNCPGQKENSLFGAKERMIRPLAGTNGLFHPGP